MKEKVDGENCNDAEIKLEVDPLVKAFLFLRLSEVTTTLFGRGRGLGNVFELLNRLSLNVLDWSNRRMQLVSTIG